MVSNDQMMALRMDAAVSTFQSLLLEATNRIATLEGELAVARAHMQAAPASPPSRVDTGPSMPTPAPADIQPMTEPPRANEAAPPEPGKLTDAQLAEMNERIAARQARIAARVAARFAEGKK